MTSTLIIGRSAADLAQAIDGVGERELFAGHAGDESSAANLAAGLEAAVHARQLTPRRGVRLARQHAPEDDAVAAQQRPRLRLDGRFARKPPSASAASSDHRPACTAPLRRGPAAGRGPHDRPQTIEPVGRDQPGGDELADARTRSASWSIGARRQLTQE